MSARLEQLVHAAQEVNHEAYPSSTAQETTAGELLKFHLGITDDDIDGFVFIVDEALKMRLDDDELTVLSELDEECVMDMLNEMLIIGIEFGIAAERSLHEVLP